MLNFPHPTGASSSVEHGVPLIASTWSRRRSVLFLQYVGPRRIADRRMGSATGWGWFNHAAGPLVEPGSPVGPPASVVAGCGFQPVLRVGRLRAGPRDPVGPLAAGRVDDSRDVTAGSLHETHVAAEELGDAPGGVPR